MDANLNFPRRRLIALSMEHGDLNALIDHTSIHSPLDELVIRRLKRKRLALRDEIVNLQRLLHTDVLA